MARGKHATMAIVASVVLVVLLLVLLGVLRQRALGPLRGIKECQVCTLRLAMACDLYTSGNDGWYGASPEGELAAMSLMADEGSSINFATFGTMHRQRQHVKEHGVLSGPLCPFKYVQGLRADDPKDLIVLYTKTKTKWMKKYKAQPVKRWLVMAPGVTSYW